nr:hypothetical protein [uncultured Cohaesibacter sp.]
MINPAQARLVTENSIPALLDKLENMAEMVIKSAAKRGHDRAAMDLQAYPERVRKALAHRLKKLGFGVVPDGAKKRITIRWSEDTL